MSTDSMDMSLSRLWELVMVREACVPQSMGSVMVREACVPQSMGSQRVRHG